jgi:hypothetical protein
MFIILMLYVDDNLEVIGYLDADFIERTDSHRSTSDYVFTLASGAISWRSCKQTITTSSTVYAEFIACYELIGQAWRHDITFFLGIQVKQTKQRTFMHQVKYTDIMKKFNMVELKPVSTPMSSMTSLGPNEDGKAVDQREYRSMIGSLLYLTVIRPDI